MLPFNSHWYWWKLKTLNHGNVQSHLPYGRSVDKTKVLVVSTVEFK